jgi:hypothetical protein
MAKGPHCRQCWLRPARAADEFCSDACAHTWSLQCERMPKVKTTGGEIISDAWLSIQGGYQRPNLQNSA